MVYLIAFLFALSVITLVQLVIESAPTRSRAVGQRLAELERLDVHSSMDPAAQRRNREREKEELQSVVRELGEWMASQRSETATSGMRLRLVQAGFRKPSAIPTYLALRLLLPILLAATVFLALPLLGLPSEMALLAAAAAGIAGWIGPSFFLDSRIRRRQEQIQLALPDTLDLLVICVEAGLGLNQAILRVAEEIRFISGVMSEELLQVDLEIRAGTPREAAFRNLADRTQVRDLRSFVTMLIQTDRFGTSIAHALRIHADSLRTKRRQRAEEAAAKTPIKLLLPLVTCVFPTLFTVLLGPAIINISTAFQGMG